MTDMPIVRRQQARRSVKISMLLPGDRAHRHRHELRSECRRTDFSNRSFAQPGEQRQCVEIAGLALIDRHSGGGVTLQMLDRNKVFTYRQFDVRHGDVIHEINPLATRVSSRRNSAGLQVVTADRRSRNIARRTREASFARRLRTCARAICQCISQ